MGGDDNRRMTDAIAEAGGLLPLPDWALIRAHGDEAARFLQGQLTQDVEKLPPHLARPAGYCSAKGRLLGSFVMWRPAADEVLLACSADLAPALVKRLSMFVLRAKVRLTDVTNGHVLQGLAGTAGRDALGGAAPAAEWQVTTDARGATVVRLPDALGLPRYLRVAPLSAAAIEAPALARDDWDWLEVHSGLARVVAATAEQFVPQMLNYEVLGAVDFRKGCYPGQEVVARSQYRGTLKRRTQLFTFDGQAQPGDEVFHDADAQQPAGLVALSARRGGRGAALVEVKLAALDSGALHLRSTDGPRLDRGTLPYVLPVDAG